MMRTLLAFILACLLAPSLARADCPKLWTGTDQADTLGNSANTCLVNTFDGGLGGDTLTSVPGSTDRYIYARFEESVPQNLGFDRINVWNADAVIDIAQVCTIEFHVTCAGPWQVWGPKDWIHGPGAVYYQWLPDPNGGWSTVVWVDLDGDGLISTGCMYIVIEGGRFVPTGANFAFGPSQ